MLRRSGEARGAAAIAGRLQRAACRLAPDSGQRGKAIDQAGRDGHDERERQHGSFEGRLSREPDPLGQRLGERRGADPGEENTCRAAGHGKDQPFREQLRREAGTRGPERHTNRELPLASRRLREQEVRHVHAGDEQDEDDRSGQRIQRRLEAVEQRVERRDVEFEQAVGALLDQLADLVAVPGAVLDQRQHQELGAALLHVRGYNRVDTINGLPALILSGPHGLMQTTAFEIHGDVVQAIYIVRNPEKLRHLGPF